MQQLQFLNHIDTQYVFAREFRKIVQHTVTRTFLLAMKTIKRMQVHFPVRSNQLSWKTFPYYAAFPATCGTFTATPALEKTSEKVKAREWVVSSRAAFIFTEQQCCQLPLIVVAVLTSGTVGTTLLLCYCLAFDRSSRMKYIQHNSSLAFSIYLLVTLFVASDNQNNVGEWWLLLLYNNLELESRERWWCSKIRQIRNRWARFVRWNNNGHAAADNDKYALPKTNFQEWNIKACEREHWSLAISTSLVVLFLFLSEEFYSYFHWKENDKHSTK